MEPAAIAAFVSTPERREIARKENEERREKFGHRLAQTPAHYHFLFGKSTEIAIRAQLHAEPNRHYLGCPVYRRLAEAYAMQARFQDAAETSDAGQQRATYEAQATAMRALNVKLCECPITRQVPDGKTGFGRKEDLFVLYAEVYDGKRHILIRRCCLCQTLSASQDSVMPTVLAQHSKGREMTSDAQ